jgi:hypothetical protein
MGQVKFGVKQVSQPAPLGWRRFERAFIIMIAPAIGAFVTGLKLDPHIANLALLTLGFVTSIVKGFGMFLGNGQMYVDRPGEEPQPDAQP